MPAVATSLSIIAILISLASLAMNIRQNRLLQRLRKHEKANAIIRHSVELRKKSQDLRNKINCTDDFENQDEFLDKFDGFVERGVGVAATQDTTSIEQLFELEKGLLSLELELDLLAKTVNEWDRWNKEVQEYNASANK